MSAAVVEKPAMDSSLQKKDGKSKSSAGGGVGNGAVGRWTTASDGAKTGAGDGSGKIGISANGDRPSPPPTKKPAATSGVGGQSKKRRVIDDDDDDDALPPAPRERPSPAAGLASKQTAVSSSSSSGRGSGMNGSSSSTHFSEKKKIVVGPSSRGSGGGGGAAGTKNGPSSNLAMSPKAVARGPTRSVVHDDDDDADLPVGAILKKKQMRSSSNSVSGSGGSSGSIPKKSSFSKNGIKRESSATFQIPKRDGLSSRPTPSGKPGSSSSPRAAGGSLSKGVGSGGRYGGDVGDSDFERKPNKLKRPADPLGRRADEKDFQNEDPAKAARRKRKLEEERDRLREEARKKKRRDMQGSGTLVRKSGSGSAVKPKVKPEPRSRGSASSLNQKTARSPRAAGRGGGGDGSKRSGASGETKPRKFKEMTRTEKIAQAMTVYKWWEEPAHAPGKQWDSLEHTGALFASEYKPHGIKLKYDGKDVYLTPQQEEVATFYASMPLNGPQLAEQGAVFNKNFFTDFKTVLGKGHKIKDFKLLDFSAIRAHLETAKQIKRAATDGEKAVAKTAKEELTHKYSYAIVDDHLEKIGNYNVEPPSLFRGRGKHPKTGMLKARVMPCDIALNCAETACVPRCPVPGYGWQNIQHDPSVTWLSKWEGILAGTKYMMLAASSSFKGKSDMAKYDKAMKLKGFIERIRADYTKKLGSKTKQIKQIATAVWIIDKLALRVGGEKGDDEADTVGCCSLRREHLTFSDNSESHELELEFLGKDSMLFKESIDFDKYGELGVRVFENLQKFCQGKRQSEQVFDHLDPSILNQHLQSLMPGLTAKVFRTYNASDTLQRQLPEEGALENLSVPEKVALYNGANREVAILCNHQKTVSSAQKEGLEKLHDRLAMLKKQRRELKEMLISVKKGKRVKLKSSDKSAEDGALRAIAKAKAQKANAKTDAEKVAATHANEAAQSLKKAAAKSKQEEMHLFAKTPGEESLVGRIKNWGDKIKKLQIDIRDRDDNKEVSLSTSKINYMDPRVSVAWCKRHEVPVEKVFAKTLRDKFVWAMNVPPDWEFSYETLLNSKQSVVGVPRASGKANTKVATPAKASPKAKATTAVARASSPPAAKSTPAAVKVKVAVKTEDDEEGEESSSEEEDDDDDGDSDSGDEEDSDDESGESGSSEEESSSEEDDNDDDDEEEESVSSTKRPRGGGDGGSSNKKARRPTIADDDDDEEEEDDDDDGDESDFAP